MSDFTAIGQLVTEARNLLDSIKGGAIRAMETQFEALKQQFNDKLNAVTPELTAFINQQKTNVNTIFSEPDKRYQVLPTQTKAVVVGGSVNVWYPVVIGIPAALTHLSINRHANADSERFGTWNGALSLDMRVSGIGWGAKNPAVLVDRYKVGMKGDVNSRVLPDADVPFVGRINADVGPNHLVIWLRGETTYALSCHDGQASFTVHDDGASFQLAEGTYPVIGPMNVADGAKASVPSIGYIRGA